MLRRLVIGLDIGGTNTDLTVIEPEKIETPSRGVIAWTKSVTTPDVSVGIERSIEEVLGRRDNEILRDEIISVTIGTTHFINAVIERDANRLDRVAVLRLCGPYGKDVPPFSDFPHDLRDIISGYVGFVDGGYNINSVDISEIDEQQVKNHCAEIRKLGILSVAIIGIFSPIKGDQETQVRDIVLKEIPNAAVVMSHTISGLGFIERENATILNASIKKFGHKIIKSFVKASRRLGLKCPVMLSQNDGTVLSVEDALETPIRTFSSGATNSMRGAAILCQGDPEVQGKSVAVVDVGGTTTDAGILLSTGFPRQSTMYSYVGGVRMNFSMPHVLSIGLGGGSIVRGSGQEMTVGPDSLGSDIVTKGVLFGGDVVTTSDVAVASFVDKFSLEQLPPSLNMGNPNAVYGMYDSSYKESYYKVVTRHLEKAIDRVKTSRDDIPVIIVGGGAFISPNVLKGASKVIKPPYAQVANAIGAALGKISASASAFRNLKGVTDGLKQAVLDELIEVASMEAYDKGALKESIKVVDLVSDAVPYVEGVYDFRVKVVGDVDYDRANEQQSLELEEEDFDTEAIYKKAMVSAKEQEDIDYLSYVPDVTNGTWTYSELDIEFAGHGAYIMGCGGGGDPHGAIIKLKKLIREGHKVQSVTLDKFSELTAGKGLTAAVGYFGSPIISGEKLKNLEIIEAIEAFERWNGHKIDGIYPLEIGGDNGLQGLWASCIKGVPCLDLDLMGRAYPALWQTIPSAFRHAKGNHAVSISDSNGLQILIHSSKDDIQLENVMRDSFYNQGCQGGFCLPFMGIDRLRKESIPDSMSRSWRIGRAVYIARASSDLDNLPKYIIDAVGGEQCAKHMLTGKIVSVEKKLKRGYGYGVVEIESVSEAGTTRTLTMPFKNENIVLYGMKEDGSKDVLCSVPDLITLVDEDGNAVGTQDYRYGLVVYVMVFACSPLWRTPEGIKAGAPAAFGESFKDIIYKPTGEYKDPLPVSVEFDKK